jgi:2-C-methyl-D-erythritol 4-phosphate cytidylyltransferase
MAFAGEGEMKLLSHFYAETWKDWCVVAALHGVLGRGTIVRGGRRGETGRVRLMRMVAVVLGGGVGQRLGAGMPKQLLTLGGRTLVERCVAAFDQAPGVDEILVVMARGYTEQVKVMLADSGYGKVTDVIEGGATRPDSTRIALAAIAGGGPGGPAGGGPGGAAGLEPLGAAGGGAGDDCGVLLHDAARPLVDQQIIADCVASLGIHDAAGVAVPTSDTIVITEGGVMRSVPRRETLFRCQTPQCFRLQVIARAHELAAADPDFAPTDDCGVVLRYLPGVDVHIVPGSERNIKITYPQDLAVAEALLAGPPAADR